MCVCASKKEKKQKERLGWRDGRVGGLLCNVTRSDQANITQIFIHRQMKERIRYRLQINMRKNNDQMEDKIHRG